MSKVYIEKLDETYLRVWSDNKGVEREIHEQFTFEVPGYKYNPAYKSGKWDGKIRLYNFVSKLVYCGLENVIESFVSGLGYEVVKKVSCKSFYEAFDPLCVTEYLSQLSLSKSSSEPLNLYDYQIDAIVKAITSKRIILLSPTASGKSIIIYCIIRFLLDQDPDFKVALVVPSKGLVEQMFTDFKNYSIASGWGVEKNVQKISGDYDKKIWANVVITTWQSIVKKAEPEFMNQFNAVIVDEAHEAKAKSLTAIMEASTHVEFKIGATGTLDDCQMHHLALTGVFGTPYQVITTKELMDAGAVSQLKIKCLLLDHPEEVKKLFRSMQAKRTLDYQKEIDYIVTNENRNHFIANLASDLKGNTLILFNFVEKQGSVIRDLLSAKTQKNVYYIDGSVSADDREAFRHKVFEGETNCIVLASYGTTSRGYSIPNIDNIIFASPTKSKIRNLQSIGRGLRLSKGKTHCTLYDVSDDLIGTGKDRVGNQLRINFTHKHFLDRLDIYSREQFTYKVIRINLK